MSAVRGWSAPPPVNPNGNRVPLNLQELTGSGNFVAPVDGVYRVTLTARGGNGAAGQLGAAGGGGGAGSTSIGIFTLTAGQIVPYDITQTQAFFSSVAELNANAGGNANNVNAGVGGVEGTGTALVFSTRGGDGSPGQQGVFGLITVLPMGGVGGASYFGGGGRGAAAAPSATAGTPGRAYGSGGGGGNSVAVLGGGGGSRAPGVVLVEW